MSLPRTESEMLERRCRAWEKTRQHGQVLYSVGRGAILSGSLFLVNSIRIGISGHKMSYEALAVMSIVFFLMGCWEAPRSWKRAERRYEADKLYLEVMRQQNSNTAN
jgi:hypothetical protein